MGVSLGDHEKAGVQLGFQEETGRTFLSQSWTAPGCHKVTDPKHC